MLLYEVRNTKTGALLGTVAVERAEDVLDQLAKDTGGTVDDIARSLGDTAEAAMRALSIVEVSAAGTEAQPPTAAKSRLAPRSMFRAAPNDEPA